MRKEGWKSRFYPESVSKKWVNRFWASYPRATDILLDFCLKNTKDLWKLASRSQRGWNLFKKAVASIDQTLNYKKCSKLLKDPVKFAQNSVAATIQMLSGLLADDIFCTLEAYPEEARFLTDWFKQIIKVEQVPSTPQNMRL